MYKASFVAEYKKLNKEQKRAVDTTEGPVMVIAGPGTGKTQVITLRIGHILRETDTPPDGVLCLTFTNAGVEAMRKRLYELIGTEASKVSVSTFHTFGTKLIEEFYPLLGLSRSPRILEDDETLSLIDHILTHHEWQYLRPRYDAALYFRDLKSLVSLLARESISPEGFLREIEKDVKALTGDPESLSSRGARKGELKVEVLRRIEALEKTKETVHFYERYMEEKRERNVLDYDDILTCMVRLAEESEEVRQTLCEKYLYVLVDEHQDSSGVQNKFLQAVWGGVERPNIFVVGDDRQLIYGFSGASLSYFKEFKESFPGTIVITLVENYRSTRQILEAADHLLQSTLAEGKLSSNRADAKPVELVECASPRDEILAAAEYFKREIESGVPAEECALLVPKNSQARAAATILRSFGLPVSTPGALKLFETPEFQTFLHILEIVSDPHAAVPLAELVLDPLSGVPALVAHEFLHRTDTRELSVKSLVAEGEKATLLAEVNPLYRLGKKLEEAVSRAPHLSVYDMMHYIGSAFFLDIDPNHADYLRRVEVARSLIHLALGQEEHSGRLTLKNFIAYLNRLLDYGEDVPLTVFDADKGVRVLTLHGSKGLEFEVVWIAHLNERSLMGGRSIGFTLPEALKERLEKKDEAAAKREVYVALTRAKRSSTLSYAQASHRGNEERLASILEGLPEELFGPTRKEPSKALLMPETHNDAEILKEDIRNLVREHYTERRVSVTLLNNFYDCPWKWYFRSFLEVPEAMAETLEFGSVIHAAIEQLVVPEKKPTAREIERAMVSALDECHVYAEERRTRYLRESLPVLKRFVADVLPDLYERHESERSLSRKEPSVPELTIYGKVDLIEYHDGDGARVTDFKTGRTRKASEVEKEDDEGRMSTLLRQLAMYTYLLESAGKGRVEVESSRLVFVEEGDASKAEYRTHIGAEHIELLVQDIKDYAALMKSGEWTERPCNHKPRTGEPDCPYCERARAF